MFDFYGERTPDVRLQGRAAYPQALAMLIVSGVSSASLFSHRVPRRVGIVLYCCAFALLCWSHYLRTRATRLPGS